MILYKKFDLIRNATFSTNLQINKYI